MALPRRPRARARPADRAVRLPQVSFRPIRLEEYDDTIQFFTEKGSFVVPIKAYIPRISSRVPESLDFGFCPCRETGTKTFHVVNDGEIPIEFKWTCNSPFTLSPRSGTVAAGSTATITARFQPTDACVYVAHCVCVVPGHTSHTMKLGGIGKYPFVAASLEMVDFAHVPTGASETKHFKLFNKSLVYARWKVERRESDCSEPMRAEALLRAESSCSCSSAHSLSLARSCGQAESEK